MGSVDIPDTEEIHRIAYLTLHGWEYTSGIGCWTKDGFTHTEFARDNSEYEEEVHSLEQAYEAQKERIGEG